MTVTGGSDIDGDGIDEQDTERWPRCVGGHPVLDFVNTDVFSGGDPRTDVLRSGDEFLAWSAAAGVGAPHATSSDAATALLRDAGRLRAGLRGIVEAISRSRPADPHALAALHAAAAEAMRHAVPALEDGRLTWQWASDDPRTPLRRLASAAVDLLRELPRGRVKACPGCGFVFLDATRNGGRRWCSMEDCGTQEKMRRYVTRRAGRPRE